MIDRLTATKRSRNVLLKTICFLLIPWTGLAAAEPPPTLLAGAAAVDITPLEYPLNMPGGFAAKKATSAHDPLHARAIVLKEGSTTLAMVVVDSLGAPPEVLDEAKSLASAQTGIPVHQMLICSTHTHSGPPSNSRDASGPAANYRNRLIDGIAKSMTDAFDAMVPASVGVSSHPLAEEVFNRRWHLKPGKMPLNPFGELDEVKMNPGTNPDVLDRPAGPVDPDITVISIQDRRQRPLALFANYSLHYVGSVPAGQLSADYFGEFSRLMRSRMRGGDSFVAMMSNGTSGDVNNIPFLVTRPPREPFEQIRIVARKAADTAWLAHRKIRYHRAAVRLKMLQREIPLRYRRPTAEQLARARAVLEIRDTDKIDQLPKRAQNYARMTIKAAERDEDRLSVPLQAIQIGDLAVCGIPFETVAEIGLELKDRSPFSQTMVIGLANGRHGYLPTPRQHRQGGYETWLGTNLVQPDASVIIVDTLLEMLTQLSPDDDPVPTLP